MSYCCNKCKKTNWKAHKTECKKLARAMAAGRAAHAAAAAVEAALMEGTAVEGNLEETSAELREGPSASLGPCSEGTGHAS